MPDQHFRHRGARPEAQKPTFWEAKVLQLDAWGPPLGPERDTRGAGASRGAPAWSDTSIGDAILSATWASFRMSSTKNGPRSPKG